MSANGSSVRLIAFVLPQFHPIPENDAWWGKGFTEWTNVTKAQPLYPGHYQPHLPADLGFYDLRLPETRQAQAELARQYGIYGFCYHHYWFHGRRLLERPVDDLVRLGEPDFPFCLSWANENWTRVWDGLEKEVLLQQTYSADDDLAHVRYLIPIFHDPRYIRVDGKPLFLVYRSRFLSDARATTDRWRREAERQGLPGLYLCRVENRGLQTGAPADFGFDAAVEWQPDHNKLCGRVLPPLPFWPRVMRRLRRFFKPITYYSIDYGRFARRMMKEPVPDYRRFPCVSPGWDNTARRGALGIILYDSAPTLYQEWLTAAIAQTSSWPGDERMVFINAWNEWAEGCHLEPDQRFGHAYLQATKNALQAEEQCLAMGRN